MFSQSQKLDISGMSSAELIQIFNEINICFSRICYWMCKSLEKRKFVLQRVEHKHLSELIRDVKRWNMTYKRLFNLEATVDDYMYEESRLFHKLDRNRMKVRRWLNGTMTYINYRDTLNMIEMNIVTISKLIDTFVERGYLELLRRVMEEDQSEQTLEG